MNEMEDKLEAAVRSINSHAANNDIHISHLLLKLFDERFESIRVAQAETRTDVQRIEVILTANGNK